MREEQVLINKKRLTIYNNMKQFKTKNGDIQVPDSWMDINFEKFLQLKAFEKTANDYEDPNEYNLKYICLMLNLTEEEYFEYDLSVDELKEILVIIYSFCQKELPILDYMKVKIKDKIYAFDKDTSLMSVGRFIDKENAIRDVEYYFEVGDKIAASFLREVETNPFKKMQNALKKKSNIKKYNAADAKVNSELFRTELPMPYIHSIVVFFLTGVNNFAYNMKFYSQQQKV